MTKKKMKKTETNDKELGDAFGKWLEASNAFEEFTINKHTEIFMEARRLHEKVEQAAKPLQSLIEKRGVSLIF